MVISRKSFASSRVFGLRAILSNLPSVLLNQNSKESIFNVGLSLLSRGYKTESKWVQLSQAEPILSYKLSQCWVKQSWVWASSVSELRLQDWVTREAKECSRSFLHMKYKCQSINPKVYVPYKYIFPIMNTLVYSRHTSGHSFRGK